MDVSDIEPKDIALGFDEGREAWLSSPRRLHEPFP